MSFPFALPRGIHMLMSNGHSILGWDQKPACRNGLPAPEVDHPWPAVTSDQLARACLNVFLVTGRQGACPRGGGRVRQLWLSMWARCWTVSGWGRIRIAAAGSVALDLFSGFAYFICGRVCWLVRHFALQG